MALLLPRPRLDAPDPAFLAGPTTPTVPTPVGTAGPDRLGSRRAALTVLVGSTVLSASTLVLVGALLVGGGGPAPATPGLPSAGPVTGWGLPVAGLLVRGSAVATVGALVLASLLLPGSLPGAGAVRRRAVRAAGLLSLVWLGAESVRLLLLASSLAGVPVTGLPLGAVLDVLTGLAPGRAALLVLVLLSTVAVGSLLPVRLPAAVLLLLTLAALLAPVLLAGHSAAAADHAITVSSLAVHVVTASVWVGGLGALLLLGRGLPEPGPAVRRFSALALGCALLLGGSGALSAVVLTGARSPAALLPVAGSGYGLLLLAKSVALVLLVAAGAWHRSRTVAALEAGRRGAFLRLAVAELGLMAATVAVAVALSASPPVDATAPDAPTGDDSRPVTAAAAAAPDAAAAPAEADPMAGHDHGELSVGILVDGTRIHVAGSVRPGQLVTVYNSGDRAVTITAEDGSFDTDVAARTFVTFAAPTEPGEYAFSSRTGTGFADTLVVEQA